MAASDSDDEPLQLSASTLAALQQFQSERDLRTKHFEDLKAAAESDFDAKPLSMDAFAEDWNASQFWYAPDTALALAKELLSGATSSTRIACVSAPSVFVQLKNLLSSGSSTNTTTTTTTASSSAPDHPQITLLEYDTRFSVFKEFIAYDFAHPTRLPAELKGAFDRIVVDPPFLSADCQTKAAVTVRWLAREWGAGVKVMLCTGERMEGLVTRLYAAVGLGTTDFVVEHAKGLSNEFRCYANWEGRMWSIEKGEGKERSAD